MSQENVEAYHRALDAFHRRDLDTFVAIFDSDVEFTPRSVEVDGSSYRGRDGVRSWWNSMFTVFSDYEAEVEEVRDLGHVTFSRVVVRGHGNESGASIEQTQWHVIEWRHGSATYWRTFRTEADALDAVPLR